tara:strand:+ start:27600 stop:27956 length:357 start_codon:yes stop_codon:yes gene_type:complete
MLIAQTGNSHSFYTIPRPSAFNGVQNYSFRIRNLDTNKDTGGISNVVFNQYYMQLNIVSMNNFSLKEGTFYDLIVYGGNADEVIYKDLIFCTDQNIEDYSINEGEYIEHESTNEYIVL